MFSKNFYPTPPNIIQKMLSPYTKGSYFDWKTKVLEPSAGKGDILDYIASKMYSRNPRKNLFAIELDPNLQAILREKDYKVIGEDFLSCYYPHSFDLIVMNPPFDKGAKHLLKAWEVLQKGMN